MAHFKNPAMPSVAVAADAAIKIASARQEFAATDTFLEMIGFDQADKMCIRDSFILPISARRPCPAWLFLCRTAGPLAGALCSQACLLYTSAFTQAKRFENGGSTFTMLYA